MTDRRSVSALLWLGPLLLAWLAAQVIATSNNSLRRHPVWHSAKEELARPPMGSGYAVDTRNLLHRNRLNLEVWHGCQEVYRAAVPGSVSCELSFKLGTDGALLWLLDRRVGVRLSHRGSAWVEIDPGGEYLDLQPLKAVPGGWHQGRLSWQQEQLTLQLDGEEWSRRPMIDEVEGSVSLRGNMRPVTVDDLVWCGPQGNVLNQESFALPVWPSMLRTLPVVALLVGLLWLTTRSQRVCGRAQLIAIALLCGYWAFDYGFWSARYPYEGYTPWGTQASTNPFEVGRERLSQLLDSGLPSKRRYRFPPLPEGSPLQWSVPGNSLLELSREAPLPHLAHDKEKVLLLGTSQSRGSGARLLDESLGHQLQKRLDDAVVLNTSVSGVNLATLLTDHERYLKSFQPTVVLANLGNNDAYDWPQFEASLNQLLELNTRFKARTVLCLEANSPEADDLQNLEQYHEEMRQWAQANRVPCLELHQHLAKLENTGVLWWDQVHMTSYGQSLAAEFLARNLPGRAGHSL